MTNDISNEREATFDQLRQIRSEALHHARMARQLAVQRRELIQLLIDEGCSQATIGRELGVSRQAIQKMLPI